MKAIRFHPPAVEATSELRWVLHRAFAGRETAVSPPLDPTAALDIARRLGLVGRIGTRTSFRALEAEVGPAVGEIAVTVENNAALSLRSELALRKVTGLASSRRTPLVILKGGALRLLGAAAPGARSFGDLDILVPTDRIHELRADLLLAGWRTASLGGAEYHGPPLAHPSLGLLELHRYIPGVCLAGSTRFFDARALLDAGLTVPIAGFQNGVRAPARGILIAHAVVHAVCQHGFSPWSYPLFRFLADLQDVGAGSETLADAGRYLREMDTGDLKAVAELAAALESGTALDLPSGPSRLLLDHLVAGVLDVAYAARLSARRPWLPAFSTLPRWLVALRKLYTSTVLSRSYIDKIYGPQRHWTGYTARRLLRPFDLAFKIGRRLRVRLRG